MKKKFLLLFSLFLIACTGTPEAPTSKEITAQKKIQSNKTEAQKAKDAYLILQRQRDRE